jgi:hypothetical protein
MTGACSLSWRPASALLSKVLMRMTISFGFVLVCAALPALPLHAATLYVWQDSPSAGPPYGTWATAAHGIQDAVDAAQPGDTVLVTNGVYATGGRAVYGTMTNRVTVDRPVTLTSINGPESTIIQGAKGTNGYNSDGAVRCVYLASGATLSGMTLTNGATNTRDLDNAPNRDLERAGSGGGLWCESSNAVATNCVFTGNSAWQGGGAYGGTLSHCILIGNAAGLTGGGARGGTLNGCTLASNSANSGGGACSATLKDCLLNGNSGWMAGGGATDCTLTNCTVMGGYTWYFGGGVSGGALDNCVLVGNTASSGGGAFQAVLNNCVISSNDGDGAFECALNNCTLLSNLVGASESTLTNCILYYNRLSTYGDIMLSYCCTVPAPGAGFGNITNEPAFVDLAGGDFHLQPSSPCINGGNNAYVTSATDLDGNPRIVNGTVDIGAYEYQGAGSTISYAWLQQFGLPTDGSADHADPDADRSDNWQEWMADTNPTNAASCLTVSILSNTPPVVAAAPTSTARLYTLLFITNLAGSMTSTMWAPVPSQIDIPGNGSAVLLTDTNPPAPAFYRVSVRFR